MKWIITTLTLLIIGFTTFHYSKNQTSKEKINRTINEKNAWKKVTQDMVKHLQGPPAEFSEHKLPLPKDNQINSDSATFPVIFSKIKSSTENLHKYEWRGHLAVDTEVRLTISLISIYTGMQLHVLKPGESEYTEITQDTPNVFVVAENLAWGTKPLPTSTYAFEGSSLVKGLWTIMITTQQRRELPELETEKSHLTILVDNISPLQIQTHLANYNQRVGEPIGLVTKIIIEENEKTKTFKRYKKMPKVKSITLVDMAVTTPNGKVSYISMKDDGKNMDGKPLDGQYGATIIAEETGSYLTQVQFSGETEDGHRFVRTSQHILSVVKESLKLESQATFHLDGDVMTISLEISENNNMPIVGKKFKTYAEVWGKDSFGKSVAVAWIGGMSIVESSGTLPVELNLKWISKTKSLVGGSFELRNVYIQETTYNVPLAQVEHITLTSKMNIMDHIRRTKSAQFSGQVSEEMLVGYRPERYKRKNKKKGDGVVVLSHGYCSSSVPFRSSDFTNFALFLDPNANRMHDEFALRLKAFGEQFKQGFSLVAHSQGGMASLHLLSFYWSNQDLLVDDYTKVKDDNRIVQTVGSPYNGNSMAGTLAAIGRFIGFGCGANSNMDTSGAKLWMVTIPKFSREQVFFYKTQYQRGWCQFAAQAVLGWPNDGTTENKFAKLKDARHQGLKKGWCHVSGMRWENQCLDSTNNRIMNAKAAR